MKRKPKSKALEEYSRQARADRLRYAQGLSAEEKTKLAKRWAESNPFADASSESWREIDRNVHSCLSDSAVGLQVVKLIWGLLSKSDDLSGLGVLIEDYLSIHGEAVISEIEELAIKEANFKNVLQYVYRNTMPESVYNKVRLAGAGRAEDA